jgi:hypothetical protein
LAAAVRLKKAWKRDEEKAQFQKQKCIEEKKSIEGFSSRC